MEEEFKPIRQQQRRLNRSILDVVKKKVTKLLAAGIIYPISDSQWIHIAPEDQHKTTFTYPFCTFAYNRMPIGLCNAPISNKGIEVDKSKIDIISSLPNPASVREVRSFLGHVGFYRRFIKNFSKLALPLFKLLQKDVDFNFDQPCIQAFRELKNRLISALILQAPNWDLPFELMCDASNSALGAVVG
ncbi:Retrovirus-related Pol polyprotein from transposon opus, partial [Mucuna pruriens]